MIYEKRTYLMKVHMGPEFLKVYQDRGLAIISKYATLIGCWETETGPLNSVVFIWAYENFEHRIQQRKKLWSDPDWLEFVPLIRQHMERQESVFLLPAPFSPIQ